MSLLSRLLFQVAFLLSGLLAIPSLLGHESPRIEFIGTASIPGDASDLSGDAALLENGEPRNRLGGFSALDFSGKGNIYAALSDRGPDDGAVGYPCRVQLLEIRIEPESALPVSVKVIRTTLLTDSQSRQFTGSSAAIEATKKLSHRLDPEGFRFAQDGGMFVSDEYGPVLIHFGADGREHRRFKVPEHFLVKNPHADKKRENQNNHVGRASNRGMECLAVSHDGRYLVGLMQSSLLQDSNRTEDGVVFGCNCRLVQIDINSGDTREFVYQMDSNDNGNSELLAYGPDEYIVLERDSHAGKDAKYRKLIHINLEGATDVAREKRLPADDLSPKITPVSRHILIDLLEEQWGLAGESMPEKIEGLTFGPVLADGRRTLLVGTDNDFESANASLIWVFAVTH